VLLESICHVDYEMAITSVEVESRNALQRIEAEFEGKIKTLVSEKAGL
jgi:hypothetical protein